MTTKRAILEHLTADELRGIIDHFELWIQVRRARGGLIDAIATSRKAELEPVLTGMARDRLKELCRKLELDDGGRDKAVIVARLLGHNTAAVQTSLFAASSAVASDASRDVERTTPTAGVRGAKPKGSSTNGGDLGFEAKLWQAADKLRNNMDAAEYKHVVLGLIFLKYISDAFEELHARLVGQKAEGADPEDRDEYRAERVFWVPKEARWPAIQAKAKDPRIGQLIDGAMTAIERDNGSLKGTLPKNYGRPGLDKQRLGELVDLIGTIGLGSKDHRSKDILGRVYEYFLSEFALAEGKKGGQF